MILQSLVKQYDALADRGKITKVGWSIAKVSYALVIDKNGGLVAIVSIKQQSPDGKKTFPFTTGKNKYDFIHVDKLAEQIVAASVQGEVNGVINVCTGNPISLGEQIETFIKDHNFDIKLEYGAFPDRPYDSPITYGDSTKIKKIMEKA